MQLVYDSIERDKKWQIFIPAAVRKKWDVRAFLRIPFAGIYLCRNRRVFSDTLFIIEPLLKL